MNTALTWGTSYYPEHHTPADWIRNLDDMKAMGITGLRILDFAWTALEPQEGCYTLDWLDEFLDRVHERDMWCILCTPTASPPPWLARQYPEIMIGDNHQNSRPFGNRRDVDVNSPIYQHYSAEIARVLGARFGKHPAVKGWQIDNELVGSELLAPECHSRASTFEFRQFLKEKHGDIGTLNARWGMRFWNQEFSDWGEVDTPHHERPCLGHYLDYARFFTRSQTTYIHLQSESLRAVIPPEQFISHNSTAVFDRGIDHLEYAEAEDVVGWDAYPGAAAGMAGENGPAFTGAACDLFRSAKKRAYWIFETDCGRAQTPISHYAEMAARGAASIMHWHWWTHHAHVEQGSDTICDLAGQPRPDRVAKLSVLYQRSEFAHLGDQEFPQQSAALLFSPDNVRASQLPNPYGKGGRLHYLHAFGRTAAGMRRRGIGSDVLRPGDALDGYKLVVMPHVKVLSDDNARALSDWVEAGGILVASGPTAWFDPWGVYHHELGEPLASLLGFTQNWAAGPTEAGPDLRWSDGQVFASTGLRETIPDTLDGEVLAEFVNGGPAAFRRSYGKGTLFYLGTQSAGALQELLSLATREAGIPIFDNPHDDVAIFPDLFGKGTWYFNHALNEERSLNGVTLPAGDFKLVPS